VKVLVPLIIVIQCAARKRLNAGYLRSEDGRSVFFVAKPELAPPDRTHIYARPDDISEVGRLWREALLEYNEQHINNPLGLFCAYQLYQNPAYVRLAEAFGQENLYILSAGWGLVRATLLIPYYDITFSRRADAYKRREKVDQYRDFCMLGRQTDEEVVFLGGKDYIPLFCAITSGIHSKKTIFFNSVVPPVAPGYTLRRFQSSTKTNWHYECADVLSRERTASRFGGQDGTGTFAKADSR
jgi:hypothetical protein